MLIRTWQVEAVDALRETPENESGNHCTAALSISNRSVVTRKESRRWVYFVSIVVAAGVAAISDGWRSSHSSMARTLPVASAIDVSAAP